MSETAQDALIRQFCKELKLPAVLREYPALARQARDRPDAVFLREADGEALTYEQADRLANRVAHGFAALGVERGDRILFAGKLGQQAIAALTDLDLARHAVGLATRRRESPRRHRGRHRPAAHLLWSPAPPRH